MSLAVLDPIVLANTCSMPDGQSAKLLTLLAYGGTRLYLTEGADAEAREQQQLLDRIDPSLGLRQGRPSTREAAYRKRTAVYHELVSSIPAQARNHTWGLALSQAVVDRLVHRIGVLRDTEELQADADRAAVAITNHATRWVPSAKLGSIPDYTSCVDANVSIHTALRTGAPLVVTKLASCCEPGTPRFYESSTIDRRLYPLGATKAVHIDWLVDALGEEFDYDAIDASVLERIAPGADEIGERAGGD